MNHIKNIFHSKKRRISWIFLACPYMRATNSYFVYLGDWGGGQRKLLLLSKSPLLVSNIILVNIIKQSLLKKPLTIELFNLDLYTGRPTWLFDLGETPWNGHASRTQALTVDNAVLSARTQIFFRYITRTNKVNRHRRNYIKFPSSKDIIIRCHHVKLWQMQQASLLR